MLTKPGRNVNAFDRTGTSARAEIGHVIRSIFDSSHNVCRLLIYMVVIARVGYVEIKLLRDIIVSRTATGFANNRFRFEMINEYNIRIKKSINVKVENY